MTIPYGVNIDIRDAVKHKEVMKQYNLGLNGGILTLLNLFATKFDEVVSEKRADQLDYVLVDTPGQIEIFTWSASGWIITEAFASTFPTVIAYVVDTPRSSSPVTFMTYVTFVAKYIIGRPKPLTCPGRILQQSHPVVVSAITGAGMDAFFKIIDASADEYMETYKNDLDKRREEKQWLEEEHRHRNMDKLRKNMEKSGGESGSEYWVEGRTKH
ncbi:GPN-loop GTPase QQT2-like [Papaver somniferum]|uniref:GPN-loop GTPase QQT2-like n=1 Tax=Papaver somniferum TaxID=3469 RepID=UPI000E6F60AA|nr:GPN-loop GTPase QQT2-like [Papaver somniferum]